MYIFFAELWLQAELHCWRKQTWFIRCHDLDMPPFMAEDIMALDLKMQTLHILFRILKLELDPGQGVLLLHFGTLNIYIH